MSDGQRDESHDSEHAGGAQEAEDERIRSWVDAGATSLPALIIALLSAVGGAVAVMLRRRRRS